MPYKTYQEGAKRSTRGSKVKEEDGKDVEMKDVTNTEEMKENTDMEEGGEKKKPWLQRTKEGGVKKIPKEVQKRRRNYRLKKMLTPKAPIMVLHELLGQTSVHYDVSEPLPRQTPMPALYTAKTIYDEQTFSGMGPSKSIAKNICAEQVLQYITTKSCKSKIEDDDEGNQENGDGGDKPKRSLETDTPWVSLASLALFKLFNDWQSQGYVVPAGMMRGSQIHIGGTDHGTDGTTATGEGVEAKPKKKQPAEPKEPKTLPENAQDKHPVQLLNEMVGPLEYEQTGQTGTPPSCIFTLAVTVNGETFSGQGKSKKEAKKAAAISAVGSLYNVHYPSV